MKQFIYFFALALITTGCTKKVDSNDLKDEVPYYQLYEVAYNKTDNITTASATYRVRESSGAKVQLSGAASVTANSITANTSSIDNTRYTWTMNGLNDVHFKLTKSSGKVIENEVLKTRIGNVDFGSDFPSTISKATGCSFNWTGDALGTEESLNASITTATGVEIITKAILDNKVSFTAEELKNCPAGDIIIGLYRAKTIALITPDSAAGGNISLRLSITKKSAVN